MLAKFVVPPLFLISKSTVFIKVIPFFLYISQSPLYRLILPPVALHPILNPKVFPSHEDFVAEPSIYNSR